ncbi:hypothetical protein ACN9MZ_24515 [Pseudoduganella sp. S-14]|jgi:hypothetical protein|uniref:hypothetical protein n=1 Tax=Pseudoduganella sp. S-14 TaxID=3404065 RepID=UPI003CED3D40
MTYTNRTIPVFLGTAAGLALVNILGTIVVNVLVWISMNQGTDLGRAITAAVGSPWYQKASIASQIFASAIGGYMTASLAANQRYLNAAIAGALQSAWFAILHTFPIQGAEFDIISIIIWFVLPLPASVLGAYIYALLLVPGPVSQHKISTENING